MSEAFGSVGPRVVTKIPGPRSVALCAALAEFESPSSSFIRQGKTPVVWERAKGANIQDVDGNIFVDLTGAFCVAGIGHCNDRVVRAIQTQAEALLHSQGVLNPNVPRCDLVRKLAEITPGDLRKAALVNTGAEAVELAMKTARLYNHRSTIVAFQGGFHGKTYGALTATSRSHYRLPFQPLAGDAVHVPYAYCYRCPFEREYPSCGLFCARFLEQTLDDVSSGVSGVSAVLLEPIQGHDGWIVPPPEFLREVRRICTERDILLITDEIITGFGRTGRWFAVEHSDVVPDILIVAKGIAAGFPISAVIGKAAVMDAWQPGMHSSTFLGNPVGAAACLAAIAELEERDLVAESARKGEWFKQLFVEMQARQPLIGDVRGLGMMVGVELVTDRATKAPAAAETAEIVARAERAGVIVSLGGKLSNVLKMSPPFVITEEQMRTAADIIEGCMDAVASSTKGRTRG